MKFLALALASLLLGLFNAQPSFALDPEKSPFQYNCRTWTRQNGLPADSVNALTQTKDGYIWLGTAKGLVSFDGIEFHLSDPGQNRSPVVTSLSASQHGGLWFGLEHGAFGFCDGKTVSLMGKDAWGGINLNVHSVRETRNGDLWLATETQLARLKKGSEYEAILAATAVVADRYDSLTTYEDTRGRLWIGTAFRGLFYWQNGVLTKFPDKILDGLEIRSIVEDASGNIWIGTNWGLLGYDPDFKRLDFPYPWCPVRALLVDREGTLWIGTIGNGLVRYLKGAMIQFRKQDGLADDVVTALQEDQEGSLWIGTRSGISQLSDVKIPTLGKTEGLMAEVNVDVAASKNGGLWIANGDGFTHLDPQGHFTPTSLGLTNNYVDRVFEAHDGDVYLVNAYRDVEIFSNGTNFARYPNSTYPTAMAEDSNGVVVAVGEDIFRVSRKSFVPYKWTAEKPTLGWIWNLAPGKDGSIWIASDNGITRLKDGAATMWTKDNGLPNSRATWVCEDDDGMVWAGLEKGIVRFKNGKICNITTDNGLFDNIIYAIVPDDDGNLWMHSSRGFFNVRRKSLNDFADGKTNLVHCVPFNGLDGAKSAERFAQQFAGCKTLDGRVWFPTAQGIVMIDPTRIAPNTVPPRIYLQSVRANGHPLDTGNKARVNLGKGELEFDYAGLSYIAPLRIQYRYRLEGYDKDWVDAGTRRSAFYTNLKPGEYHFQVQACNQDGVWSSSAADFSVMLLPSFYQTAWFIPLVISIILAILFGIYGWRLQQLKRKQEKLQAARDLLEAKVEERTAELKQQIEERKRMQVEMEGIHRELVDASRHAGQAEVASSVLHNVGNVLNSVNISAGILTEHVRTSQASGITRIAELLAGHRHDLAEFLATNGRSEQVVTYLKTLSERLAAEQAAMVSELQGLNKNIDHIKEIVAMQQNFARVTGVLEIQSIPDLMEDALSMHADALERLKVKVVRKFEPFPNILADRHKVLQIFVNLVSNARYALEANTAGERILTVSVKLNGNNTVHATVRDNGMGIAQENLTRIFMHGFTTRSDGHGFGLHSGSLAAQEMGGSLTVESDGPGLGATFMLELPAQVKDKNLHEHSSN